MKSKNLAFYLFTILGILGLLGMSSFVHAADTNVTVNVSIGTLSQITVSPTFINWSNIIPGRAGGAQTLDVENTGTVNVTNLYAYANTIPNEPVRPYSG